MGSTFLKRNWSMKQVADETACVSKSRWSELQICCAGEARPLCQDPWHLGVLAFHLTDCLNSAWAQTAHKTLWSPSVLPTACTRRMGGTSKDSHGSLWLPEVTLKRGRKGLLRNRKGKEGCCSTGPHDTLPARSAVSSLRFEGVSWVRPHSEQTPHKGTFWHHAWLW